MATYPIKMLRDEDRQPFIPFTNAAAVVDKDNKTLQELMDNGKYKIINNVTTTSAGKGVLDAYQGKVLKDNFNNYVPLSQKGVANGVATLDGEGKVPSTQLPSYVDDVLETYIRTGTTALTADWLSLTDGGAALTPEKGKIYLIMTAGSYQNKQYRWGGSTYVLCNPSDVNSVNGMTGVVVLKNLTIQKNGTKVGDSYNGGTAKTINITVPTNNNELINGAGYITANDNIATATKLAAKVGIDGMEFDGSADIGHFAICDTAAATTDKTASCPGFKLYSGSWVAVRFVNTNTGAVASLTLNINNTGAKPIKYRGGNLGSAGYLGAKRIYLFVYDGTNYELIGDINTNDNTYDRVKYSATIQAGEALTKSTLIVGKQGKYYPLTKKESFNITYPILYLAEAVAADATSSNVYGVIPFAIATTQTMTLVRGPVYVQGNLVGEMFTPMSTTPLTQTIPTTADGYQYLLIGYAYNSTNIYLIPQHPIFAYENGKFQDVTSGYDLYLKRTGGTLEKSLYINNTNGNSQRLQIRRTTGESESASHYLDDDSYSIYYKNDEKSSKIKLILQNTDTENSDGSEASTYTYVFASNGAITGTSFSGTAEKANSTTGALTIQKNGTQVGDTFNGSANKTINITVPTKLSELTNDGNYVKTTDYASTTAAGVIKLGTGLAIKDGIVSVTGSATADSVEWAAVKNAPTKVSYWTNDSGYLTAANTMTGATASTAGAAGVVPAPASGDQAKYLRGDGQWATVTEATKATQDGSGNTITSTYVKKAGDTMTGDLTINKATAKLYVHSSNETADIQMGTNTCTATHFYAWKADANGNDLGIQPGGNLILCSGEGAGGIHTAVGTTLGTECTWLASDGPVFFDANVQTPANRVGFILNNSGNIQPSVADVAKDDQGQVGTATANWAKMFSKNYVFGNNDATITYNSTDKCIEFNFA